MEKTIEILLVATVVLMTAVVVIFMLQGRVGSFDDFLQGQSEDAQCSIGETKFKNTAECDEGIIQNAQEAGDVRQEYSNSCNTAEWTACEGSGDDPSGGSDSGSSVGVLPE